MSNDRYWRAISVDSIDPEYFPKVALYLKNVDNYVLYKDLSRPFTIDDHRRMERSSTKFLYVRSGDMEDINRFIENSLTRMLARDDLGNSAKGRILYQTSINCVIDMFEAPETPENLARCRNLVKHILQHVASDPHALAPLKTLIDHNFYIYVHSVQVTALSLLLHSRLFDLEHDELIDVGTGSLLHDYGMTFITNQLFEKNDALSEIEYYKIKQHTQKGYEYLQQSRNHSQVVLNIVRYHHERYDGNGYPTGIKGNDIPRSGQVAAICDVYSALIMDRPQRKANSHVDAIKIMSEESKSGAFNPELFKHFVEIINEGNPA